MAKLTDASGVILTGADGAVLTDGFPDVLDTIIPVPLANASTFDFQRTIISQYANAPTLTTLIANFAAWMDPAADIDRFYDLVWNVNTAVGYGLDVWGRIVGVGRTLHVSTSKFFGFEEATNISADPFNQSPFYGGGATSTNYALSDDGFRVLILAKALANISDGSTASINQILLLLFPGRGNCYVIDNLNMTMVYAFDFAVTPVEAAIISQSGVLPRPTGVNASASLV